MENARGRHGQQNLWEKIWKDKQGNIVIWQMPNKWIIIWVVFTMLSLFFSGMLSDIFSWIGSAGLVVWSLLEILQGANYFRRALGLLILAFSIATIIKSI